MDVNDAEMVVEMARRLFDAERRVKLLENLRKKKDDEMLPFLEFYESIAAYFEYQGHPGNLTRRVLDNLRRPTDG